jgi:hypothetical protein
VDELKMPVYLACGQIIESEIPLPELPHSTLLQPGIFIRLSKTPFALEPRWFHNWTLPDGSVWLQIGRHEREYLLRFPGMADFLVGSGGAQIQVCPGAAATGETIRHLLLDQVLPAALANAGKLVLHASAVLVPGGVAAFMGRSGQGKSTLAASFCESGYALVTDDCLLFEQRENGFYGVGSYPGLRLWGDSANAFFTGAAERSSKVAHYSEKLRLTKEHTGLTFLTDPARIGNIYLLDCSESVCAVEINRISGARSLVHILQYLFHLDVKDPEALRLQFDGLSRIATSCPVYRLSFRRGYDVLGAVKRAVLEHMASEETRNESEGRW